MLPSSFLAHSKAPSSPRAWMSANMFFTVAYNTILKSEDSNIHVSIKYNQYMNPLNNHLPPGTPSHRRRQEPKVLQKFVIHIIQHINHIFQHIFHIIQHIIHIIQYIIHIIHIIQQLLMTKHL